MLRGDVARAGRPALIGRVRHCCVCSPHVAHDVPGACRFLHVTCCAWYSVHCIVRSAWPRAACTPHASCLHARYALHGASAAPPHLRRSAPPQGMLRDARRPGLWHACGAYIPSIPHGAAHGEGGLLPSAFAERECAARLCSGIFRCCALPLGRQCHVRVCDDIQARNDILCTRLRRPIRWESDWAAVCGGGVCRRGGVSWLCAEG
jgi:hypothetical protein